MEETKRLDVGFLMTALLDSMVEAVAKSLCRTPAEELKMMASLYEGIAQAASVKAAMANGLAEDAAKPEGGAHGTQR